MRDHIRLATTFAALIMLASSSAWGAGPTFISGNQSGTLYLTNSPYIVTSDMFVPGGQTLTIEPGVVLQFTNVNIGAFIDGTLNARGTAGSPILFTSDKVAKQPGQWRVMNFRQTGGTNSILENCIVECGAASSGGYTENIRIENEYTFAAVITNCTIRSSGGHGISCYISDPHIQNCVFSNNPGFAVSMRADCLPVLRNNTAQGNGGNAIEVFGNNVSRSGAWTRDNLPYSITSDLYVNNGVTLTPESGITVQFTNVNVGAFIDGTLNARGTAGSPILFTSDKVVKQPGQWRVINFRQTGGTNSILDNCIVECAAAPGGGYTENIRIENEYTSAAVITNCTIRSSGGHGISCYNSDPHIQNCVFSNNTGFAVSMRAECLPVLRNNAAHGNGGNAIEVFGNNVSRSGAWTRDDLPYTVTSDLYVNSGVTLTPEPGITVQFTNVNVGAFIDGTLNARGTAGSPILFTSDKVVKQPGQWRVMNFRQTGGTNSIMENCIVECAAAPGGSYTENIRIENEYTFAAVITNCTIRSSGGHGISCYISDPHIQNCVFSNNTGFAVSMRTDCLPVLRNNTTQGNGGNAIEVFGNNVSRSGAWTRDNLPYTVTSDLYVNNGVTLTPEPGITVQFTNVNIGAFIDGALNARGTGGSPIVFTSDKVVKQPGEWRGIDIRSTATNTVLEGCIVEYGGASAGGLNANVQFESAPFVLLTNCTFRSSLNDAIYCTASSPRIANCVIANNGRDGVRTANASGPVVTNSAISGSVGFGMNNLDTSRTNLARGNYWGHPSGPYDNANTDGQGLMNPSGLGDKVSEFVNWSPFLGSDPLNVAPPILAIALAAGQAILTWPYTVTGYGLQSATNLSAAGNAWAAVTNNPVFAEGRYTVTNSLTDPRKFFRLSK